MKSYIFLAAALVVHIAGAAAETVPIPFSGIEPVPIPLELAEVDPFAALGGVAIDATEAASIDGGDVFLDLDRARTRLKVTVVDNEYEARLGRIKPKEVYYVDAHNRLVDTIDAPFFVAGSSKDMWDGVQGLTTRPVPFPEGTWNITGVREVELEELKYGPYMIGTDAIGWVEVYSAGSRVTTAYDGGYAIHSNSNDFSSSQSYGCIVVRESDNRRIAASLKADRAQLPIEGKSRQTISVSRRGR